MVPFMTFRRCLPRVTSKIRFKNTAGVSWPKVEEEKPDYRSIVFTRLYPAGQVARSVNCEFTYIYLPQAQQIYVRIRQIERCSQPVLLPG